ncbi:MAG: response regulator [Ardenticatenaceae bacterium]|nr:response regulator [Ardenticatenaceae bacterium]MCB9443634.1 response regulator [Ardenticatenaceae bacterium]
MRILIADDESIIRLGLKKMLQEMGHEVVTAVNGREAIGMAQTQQPDLAILDIKMPYTDGLQAAQTISRSHPLPILLLTAFSEQDLIDKATDLPIHGYLVKPVKPAELSAAIAIARKRFEESQALAQRTADLETALAERKLIDRAKGKLMETGMSEAEAYQALQAYARQSQQTVAQVARALLKK